MEGKDTHTDKHTNKQRNKDRLYDCLKKQKTDEGKLFILKINKVS